MSLQSSITVNGVRLSARQIQSAPQRQATGGHSIAATKAGDIHWTLWSGEYGPDELHVFNVGAVRRRGASFGQKIAFLRIL